MSAFTTPKPITATLTTGGAQVRIVASERSDTVVRVEPINAANRSNVKVAERTAVAFAEGELSVETIKAGDKNGSVAITIELPAGSRLVLNTAFSEVRAEGQFGDCELELASGHVQLDRVGALRGRLASGSVEVGYVAGTVTVDGATAGLRIGEVAGVVKYEGASGAVSIGRALADVSLSGASGRFEVDRAEASVSAKAAHCPIRIGRMTRGQAELTNAAGGIEIGIAEGSVAVVDANSTKGTVRNALPVQQPNGNTVRVYARTRVDDIVIKRAQ